jgi:hypothetical protein
MPPVSPQHVAAATEHPQVVLGVAAELAGLDMVNVCCVEG